MSIEITIGNVVVLQSFDPQNERLLKREPMVLAFRQNCCCWILNRHPSILVKNSKLKINLMK